MEQIILQHIRQFITKFTKHLFICALLVLYLIAFWLLFFTKGIYVNDHFYRKKANLTQITYTSHTPFADYSTITLQKFVDETIVTVDESHIISVKPDGSWVCTQEAEGVCTAENTDWYAIATQKAEGNRGFGNKPWVLVVLCLAAAVFARFNSTKVYEFFNKNKAANENYYKAVDVITKVVLIAGLLYLIIPF